MSSEREIANDVHTGQQQQRRESRGKVLLETPIRRDRFEREPRAQTRNLFAFGTGLSLKKQVQQDRE